ncbi:MAG: hypothetical protein M3R17_18170 [Bacteroidota bacterium]|nr:hypothetical protein [Bacteroidota bacterium]
MSEESAAQQETQSTPKKEIPPVKKQLVYRLPNGEFDDFADVETIDKTDFHKVFHREMLKDGQLIFEVEYDAGGNEVQKTQNTFDEAGKAILHELFTEGTLAEKTVYERDAKGNVVKETREFEEGFPLTTIFKYDEEGRVIELRVDDSDGELQKRETFLYHSTWKDKVVLHEVFDEEDEISLKEENEWEEREGEVKAGKFTVNDYSLDRYRRTEFFNPRTREDNIAMATFNNKDKVTEYVKILFDEKDRELEEHSISVNDSDNFIVYYTYDDRDRVTRQEQHQQDKIMSKINRRFGESGLAELIGIRSFSRGMYVDYFEYEFHEA